MNCSGKGGEGGYEMDGKGGWVWGFGVGEVKREGRVSGRCGVGGGESEGVGSDGGWEVGG